jgi:hypothetical protein
MNGASVAPLSVEHRGEVGWIILHPYQETTDPTPWCLVQWNLAQDLASAYEALDFYDHASAGEMD